MRRSVFQGLVLLVLVVLLGGTVVIAGGGDNEHSRKTLAALPGVAVLVEEVKPPLDTATIQTDVELRLRRAGIRVLSEDERLQTAGAPSLYVNVSHFGDTLVAKSVEVELLQRALLEREPHVLAQGASTWSRSSVGTVGKSNLVDGVRKDVRVLVDMFINAWLSVNPNVKPGPQPDDEDPPKPKKPKKKKAPKPAPTEE